MSTKRKAPSKAPARTTRPKASDTPQPMDPTGPEPVSGPRAPNRRRSAYAIETLVAEVGALYPGISHEVSNYNGFNTALDVSFDLTSVHEEDIASLTTLLSMLDSEPRVARVEIEDGQALVSLHPNLRTQDIRDPFGLDKAYEVLIQGSH